MAWSENQQKAIYAKTPLIVSAAAGSGKTAVLVERIINKIVAENADIDRFLVVTFTEAAAGEVKEKISKAIREKAENAPDDRHLRRQIVRLGAAHIETVHGFCMYLIKRYFHLLDLPSKFRVASDNETALIRSQVLEEIIDEFYGQKDNALFYEFAEQNSSGRSDESLLKTVADVRNKLASLPYPEKFMEFAREQTKLCAEGRILETEMAKPLKTLRARILEYASKLEDCVAELSADTPEEMRPWEEYLATLKKVQDGQFDSLFDAIKAPLPNLPKRKASVEAKANLKQIKGKIGLLQKEWSQCFYSGEKYIKEDASKSLEMLDMLFKVLNRFNERFAEEKRRRGIIDFEDMEHTALSILSDGCGGKSAQCLEISEEFDEIFVDEFQDTNEIQEEIFNLVSRNENTFFVGDVKQSIYRFRNANPSLFMRRLENAPICADQDGFGRVDLSDNYRSRSGIIDAVNAVFDAVMSKAVGDINYEGAERLSFGAKYYDADDGFPARLDLIVENGKIDRNIQAMHIASIVNEILKKRTAVFDKKLGKTRPAVCDDIAILAGKKKNFPRLSAALAQYGIPSVCEMKDSFFNLEEIMVVTSILKAVDNPRCDIPLVAMLACPIYGFSPDELADIRLCDDKGCFYDALCKAAEHSEKCRSFLNELEELRAASTGMPADKFLSYLYEKTAYPQIVSALSGGASRRANLTRLYNLAKNYEDGGYRGLFLFNAYLDSLRETGEQIAAEETGSADGAVKIMTVHKSKGLEFPIVVLAYTESDISQRDVQPRILCDKDCGMAMRIKDKEYDDYPTQMSWLIADKIAKDNKSESMRLLYVALTRAREKLIVVGSVKAKKGGVWGINPVVPENGKISKDAVRASGSHLGWMIAALQNCEGADELRRAIGSESEPSLPQTWDVRVLKAEELAFLPPSAENAEDGVIDDEFYNEIAKRLEFVRNNAAAKLPLKTSVSRIKSAVNVTDEYAPAYRTPSFAAADAALSGADKGSATHAFLQYADFGKLSNAQSIANEIDRLVSEKYLTQEQGKACSVEDLVHFGKSEIYKRIVESKTCLREKRFGILLPDKDIAALINSENSAGESVFVQGVFDCVFFEDGAPVIVDYKTDTGVDGDELRRRYAVQLNLYARAAEEIFGKTVKAKIIYSLPRRESIEV